MSADFEFFKVPVSGFALPFPILKRAGLAAQPKALALPFLHHPLDTEKNVHPAGRGLHAGWKGVFRQRALFEAEECEQRLNSLPASSFHFYQLSQMRRCLKKAVHAVQLDTSISSGVFFFCLFAVISTRSGKESSGLSCKGQRKANAM